MRPKRLTRSARERVCRRNDVVEFRSARTIGMSTSGMIAESREHSGFNDGRQALERMQVPAGTGRQNRSTTGAIAAPRGQTRT